MKTIRINIEAPEGYRTRMKKLQEVTDSATQSEVFRKAIGLLEVITQIVRDGSKIYAEKLDGSVESINLIGITRTLPMNLVDQVDDLKDSVEDLLHAIKHSDFCESERKAVEDSLRAIYK